VTFCHRKVHDAIEVVNLGPDVYRQLLEAVERTTPRSVVSLIHRSSVQLFPLDDGAKFCSSCSS
jgi:hypothetical protein